jgi:putative transposase
VQDLTKRLDDGGLEKTGGMEISDARKLRVLEDENRKLKKLLAETMLDASTLKEMLGKNF